MALQSFTITIGALTDSGNNDKNYVSGQPVYIKNIGGTLANIYRDLAGTSQITQDGIANVTDNRGQFTFFVETGDYNAEYNGQITPITVVGPDYFNSRIDESVEEITERTLDSRGFKVVGDFATGFTYTDYNQVGTYDDGLGNPDSVTSWIYTGPGAPEKTVTAGAVPSKPDYQQVSLSDAESVKNNDGSSAQDTYDATRAMLVAQGLSGNYGFFERGFTYNAVGDVGITASGDIYIYAGSDPLPVSVPAGTNPVGDSDYEKRAFDQSSVVINDDGTTAQDTHDTLKLISNSKNTTSIFSASERKGLTPWGELAPVNLLGDSISFGYFASYAGKSGDSDGSNNGGMYYNSYASILARMLAAEFNSNVYKGFSPNTYDYGGDEDVFIVTDSVGTWNIDNSGDYAESSYSGQALSTDIQGNYREYKIPATFDRIVVWYLSQPSGGELTITVNDVDTHVIDTNSVTFENNRVVLNVNTLNFNDQGNMIVRVTKTDATSNKISFQGVGVTNYQNLVTSGQTLGGSLNQFAAPGRTLRTVSEQVISEVTNGAAGLIMALGYNDKDINYSGQEAQRGIFTQRIDWLIQYCNSNNCPIIVPDFTWGFDSTAFTRQELKRLAFETGGIYIPLPDMLSTTSGTTDAYRTDNLKMWWDGAHPNRYGHEWIAQQIARFCGLACTTKLDALKNHDYWMSLDLDAAYRNIILNQNWSCSAYKLSGDSIIVRTQIALTAGGNFADGRHFVTTDGFLFRGGLYPPINITPFELTKNHEIDNTTCELKSCATLYSGKEFSLARVAGVTKTSMNGACTFEIDKYQL